MDLCLQNLEEYVFEEQKLVRHGMDSSPTPARLGSSSIAGDVQMAFGRAQGAGKHG
jgi:hypothetical protein